MSNIAEKRLTKEFLRLQKEPLEYITAHPDEENILRWHYIINGPPDTPYHGGQYQGTLIFPPNYPFAAPSIQMITPNGKYQTGVNICVSMSAYHPEIWVPTWTVSSILLGFLSHMLDPNDFGLNSLQNISDADKREMAKNSRSFNNSTPSFKKNFPLLYLENENSK